jgi:hypothetical protein
MDSGCYLPGFSIYGWEGYRMNKFLCFIVILSLPSVGLCDDIKYTTLKGQKAETIAGQCSREHPPTFTDIWVPDEKTISDLESNLKKIEQLTSSLCCFRNGRISNIQNYFRQYIGIVSKGRRLIYINAFLGPKPPINWLTEPVMACDGGLSFWGAIFDPETGEFSQLAINGDA